MYVGAALAVGLFDRLAPSAVAVLRLIGAAAVLLAWRRPPAAAWRGVRLLRAAGVRPGHRPDEPRLLRGHRAAAAGHRGGDRVLRPGGRRGGRVAPSPRRRGGRAWPRRGAAHRRCPLVSGPLGVVWALAAAAMWAAYIVLGSRVATVGNGIDDMAVGFAAAAVLLSPVLLLGSPGGPGALVDPAVLGLGHRGRRAVQRGALRARPGRAAARGHGPVRGAARPAPRHGHGRRAGDARARCPEGPRRWVSRRSSAPSRCGRATATRLATAEIDYGE